MAVTLMAACSSGGDDAAPAPTGATVAPTTPPGSTAVPTGYKAVTLRVTMPDGTVHESCVLVAITDAERERGLMDVDGLGGYDGMLFRFGRPTTAQFYMFHTRLPLTVAFFDTDGAYVSARDMPPCTAAKGSDCAVYGADRSYVDALEVLQGGLGAVGVGPGSRIDVGGECSR